MDVLSFHLKKKIQIICPGITSHPYRTKLLQCKTMLSKKIRTSSNKTLEYTNGLSFCVSVYVRLMKFWFFIQTLLSCEIIA